MVFTTTRVLLHSASPTAFSDIAHDGKFYNFGVQALAALKAHKTIDIHYPESDDPAMEVIIPYHAVLDWNVTKTEREYTKPEDDFCKSESTPTGDITLVDGTYTFEEVDGGTGEYDFELSKCYAPTNVTVTIDGTTATLPKFDGDDASSRYGEWDDNDRAVLTTYPAAAQIYNGAHKNLYVEVSTSGEHTVKVTIPSGSEVECGGE